MDDPSPEPCSRGTQIEDLPSCLIMDILLRLPNKSLLKCRVVSRSWNLVFSDPLFVKLHLARSPTYLIRGNLGKRMKFYRSYCGRLVPGMSSSQVSKVFSGIPGSACACINSSNGLLCLQNSRSSDVVYVCNPILGEFITIKTGPTKSVRFFLGFSSRSNQFKVLRINSPFQNTAPYLSRIYTIGDGTRKWKSVGIAPSYGHFRRGGFLNGSFHWADVKTHEIFYFNFDTEQFGSLPSPPELRGRRFATIGVLDGCLFCYAGNVCQLWKMEFWIMKEYGVEESWTKIFPIEDTGTDEVFPSLYNKLSLLYENCKIQLGYLGPAYNPSFISLQDVVKGEQLTLIS